MEESPVGSHQSNGGVERAAQTIEGHIRVMKSALEERLGCRVDAERRVVTFMAEYAGYLVNRLEFGKDGKTAYERSRGIKAKVLGVEFGEKLMWTKRPRCKLEKIQDFRGSEEEKWGGLGRDPGGDGQGEIRQKDPCGGQVVWGLFGLGEECAMESEQG